MKTTVLEVDDVRKICPKPSAPLIATICGRWERNVCRGDVAARAQVAGGCGSGRERAAGGGFSALLRGGAGAASVSGAVSKTVPKRAPKTSPKNG